MPLPKTKTIMRPPVKKQHNVSQFYYLKCKTINSNCPLFGLCNLRKPIRVFMNAIKNVKSRFAELAPGMVQIWFCCQLTNFTLQSSREENDTVEWH
jgi:hypothetical protein